MDNDSNDSTSVSTNSNWSTEAVRGFPERPPPATFGTNQRTGRVRGRRLGPAPFTLNSRRRRTPVTTSRNSSLETAYGFPPQPAPAIPDTTNMSTYEPVHVSTPAPASTPIDQGDWIITLKVGERYFQTQAKTLWRAPHLQSYLNIENPKIRAARNGGPPLFLDFDGNTFERILSHLRHGVVPISYDPMRYNEFQMLHHQAQVLGLDELVAELDKMENEHQGHPPERSDSRSSSRSPSSTLCGSPSSPSASRFRSFPSTYADREYQITPRVPTPYGSPLPDPDPDHQYQIHSQLPEILPLHPGPTRVVVANQSNPSHSIARPSSVLYDPAEHLQYLPAAQQRSSLPPSLYPQGTHRSPLMGPPAVWNPSVQGISVQGTSVPSPWWPISAQRVYVPRHVYAAPMTSYPANAYIHSASPQVVAVQGAIRPETGTRPGHGPERSS